MATMEYLECGCFHSTDQSASLDQRVLRLSGFPELQVGASDGVSKGRIVIGWLHAMVFGFGASGCSLVQEKNASDVDKVARNENEDVSKCVHASNAILPLHFPVCLKHKTAWSLRGGIIERTMCYPGFYVCRDERIRSKGSPVSTGSGVKGYDCAAISQD